MALIYTENECEYTKDYYDFICDRLKKIKLEEDFALVGLQNFDTKNSNIIFINYEHNLVDPIISHYPYIDGEISIGDSLDKKYLVRIEKFNQFIDCSYYIEYSNPNVHNIKSCDQLKEFYSKIIYFPPLLCDYSPESNGRNQYDVITSFYIIDNTDRPRRKIIRDNLLLEIPKYYNIPGIFGYELYNNFYKKSKILVNLHQTEYHHTFEELRVLPALLNGLVVIAEDSPLKETIPYHEYIIWCKYDDIIVKTKEVLNNYEFYYNKIHGEQSDLKNILKKMNENLENELVELTKEEKYLSLSELFDNTGSDKGTYFTHVGQTQNIAHYYTLVYEQQMEEFRNDTINMLEIGIWSPYYPGASVKAWTKYFKKAKFYGIDVVEDCRQLHDGERINIDIVDQRSEEQLSKYLEDKPKFKFIIDDGCHEEDAIIISLGTLFPHLESGGIYYIEDLHVVDKTRLFGLFYKRFYSPFISLDKIKYINDNLDWCSFSPDGKLCIIKKK